LKIYHLAILLGRSIFNRLCNWNDFLAVMRITSLFLRVLLRLSEVKRSKNSDVIPDLLGQFLTNFFVRCVFLCHDNCWIDSWLA
jgi:hypothetical protein